MFRAQRERRRRVWCRRRVSGVRVWHFGADALHSRRRGAVMTGLIITVTPDFSQVTADSALSGGLLAIEKRLDDHIKQAIAAADQARPSFQALRGEAKKQVTP